MTIQKIVRKGNVHLNASINGNGRREGSVQLSKTRRYKNLIYNKSKFRYCLKRYLTKAASL